MAAAAAAAQRPAAAAGVAIEQLRIFRVFAPGGRAYVTYFSKETYSRIHVFPIPAGVHDFIDCEAQLIDVH